MANIVILSGSPNAVSRLNGITAHVEQALAARGYCVTNLHAASLPAEDLVLARWDSPAVIEANRLIAEADAVIIASPVYKASYTGVLKAFLDLLPQKGLEGKVVLPLFIGGTIAHLLTIDYALKPVLSALYTRHIESGVFAVDTQVLKNEDGTFELSEELGARLDSAVDSFVQAVTLFAGQKTTAL